MTQCEKVEKLKTLLRMTSTEQEEELIVYLSLARQEILSWLYSGRTPSNITDVPEQYEPTQIMACIAGLGLSGVENQTSSSENGISRTFKYSSMIEFIRVNVTPYAVVM